LRREEKDLHRRADAGLIRGGEHTSRRAAMRLLWGSSTDRGGRQALAERIGVGVARKQFETQGGTCLPWTSILERRPIEWTKRSAP